MTRDEFLERNRRLEETLKALHSASAQESTDPSNLDRLRSVGEELKVRATGLRERFDELDRPKATALVLLSLAGVVAIAVAITGTFLSDGKTNTATGGVNGRFAAAVAGPSTSGSTTTQCVTTTTTQPAPADPSGGVGARPGDATCQSGAVPDGSVNGTMPDGSEATASTEPETTGPNGRRSTTTRPSGPTTPPGGGVTPPPDGGGTIGPPPTDGPVINPPDPPTTETPTTPTTETPTTPSTEAPLDAGLPLALPAEPIVTEPILSPDTTLAP